MLSFRKIVVISEESLMARDCSANDQGVDVVSSLVGVDSLQVHDVPDDVVLVTDSISS